MQLLQIPVLAAGIIFMGAFALCAIVDLTTPKQHWPYPTVNRGRGLLAVAMILVIAVIVNFACRQLA